MSYIVTLDVFSGRENPKWVITDDLAKELESKSRDLESKFKESKPSEILGYRGIRISPIERQDEKIGRLMETQGDPDGSHYISGIPDLEDFIISTGKNYLDDVVTNHIQNVIRNQELRYPEIAKSVLCPTCQAVDAPAYNPGYWNIPARQPSNNCYNYANNQATNTFAQPGRATGNPITGLSCKGVQPSAQSDGLYPTSNFSSPLAAGKGWYVALVIWPGVDYHWYRQDDVGCWSHKPGQTAVRDVDNSGNKITDPQTCNRGNYTDFCTYMNTGNWVRIS